MSGYSVELFLENVDQEFLCGICFGVFNKPVSCQDGHSFCHHCITQWQLNHNYCPVDRTVLSGNLVRNLAVEGAISRKVMKCPSTISLPGGCNWTGPAASLENHLPLCDMKIVECNFKGRGCILRSYQRELAQHLQICPHRTEKCPSCGVEVPHSNQSGHDELCVGKLVSCPNKCGIQVERSKMLSHLAFVCTKEGRPCPLYAVGCNEVHSLADADSSSHLKLLLEARVSGACGVSLCKPTEKFQYTHYTSCHAPGVKKGFIKGEALRLLRTNSSETKFEENICYFKSNLRVRGYPDYLVNKVLAEVKFKNRKSALEQKPQRVQSGLMPFVTQYNPSVPNLKTILMSKWHLIENQPLLREIYGEPPFISYRKGKSLKDILVRAKL